MEKLAENPAEKPIEKPVEMPTEAAVEAAVEVEKLLPPDFSVKCEADISVVSTTVPFVSEPVAVKVNQPIAQSDKAPSPTRDGQRPIALTSDTPPQNPASITTPVPPQVYQDNINQFTDKTMLLSQSFSEVPYDVIHNIVERYKGDLEASNKELVLMIDRIAHYSTRKHEEAAPLSTSHAVVETGTFTVGEINAWNPMVKKLKQQFPQAGHDTFLKFLKENDADYDRSLVALTKYIGGRAAGTPSSPQPKLAQQTASDQVISKSVDILQPTIAVMQPSNVAVTKALLSNSPSVKIKTRGSSVAPSSRAGPVISSTDVKKPATSVTASEWEVMWTDEEHSEVVAMLASPANKSNLRRLSKRFKGMHAQVVVDQLWRNGCDYETTKIALKKIQRQPAKSIKSVK